MDIFPILHLATTYTYNDSINQAKVLLEQALGYVQSHNDYEIDDLYLLLLNFSHFGEIGKANICYKLIHKRGSRGISSTNCISLAQYFKATNVLDSAKYYYNLAIKTSQSQVYDASRNLFEIYDEEGNYAEALKYARMYVAASDSLDLGKRQEMAATVNNQFKYHYDQNREMEMNEREMKYHYIFIIVMVAFLLLLLSGVVLYYRIRNKNLKKTLALTKELELQKVDKEMLEKEINEKDKELETSRQQNESFIRLLHKSRLEGRSEDVINAIRESADGKRKLTDKEWQQLFYAVDDLYPDFKSLIANKLGNFTEQQMRFCYLLRIGLSNSQIENITGVAHVTVWRWANKYSWALPKVGE